MLDIRKPGDARLLRSIDITAPHGEDGFTGGGANSVAVAGGLVAVAIEARDSVAPGAVGLYDSDGNLLALHAVGAIVVDEGHKVPLVRHHGDGFAGHRIAAAVADATVGPAIVHAQKVEIVAAAGGAVQTDTAVTVGKYLVINEFIIKGALDPETIGRAMVH